MPTIRQRHILTETDDIAEAIDVGATLYPGESRADVLRHLVHLGAETIAETIAERQDGHRRAVVDNAGRHPGLYPAGYLDELREDWPA